MAETLKRIVGPTQPGTAAATLYTVPAATKAILRYIRLCNTSGIDRTITMSVGLDAAGTRIFSGMTVPALGAIDWSGSIPLEAGEVLQGFASAATAITVIAAAVVVD